jgi:hypothetical protein
MVKMGMKEHVVSMRLCADCADICALSAKIMSRKGPMSKSICQACAESCAACGAECGKYPDMPIMKRCAESCKKCSAACKALVAAL